MDPVSHDSARRLSPIASAFKRIPTWSRSIDSQRTCVRRFQVAADMVFPTARARAMKVSTTGLRVLPFNVTIAVGTGLMRRSMGKALSDQRLALNRRQVAEKASGFVPGAEVLWSLRDLAFDALQSDWIRFWRIIQ